MPTGEIKKNIKTAENKEAWYVIYTAPKAEKQVQQRLTEQGVEAFLPLHLSPRKWSDRVKLVEMPLFPSYLFVYTRRTALYDLVRIPGIARIIYFEGQPAVVRPREISAIRQFLEYANGKACRIELDDEVRVAVGPLKDSGGKVIKIGKKYAILLLDKLGLQAQVALDAVVKK
ncbi:MAG: UpxY family transcription antiterminator [Paludibacter sp.]|nr:UpxY family transcription antiterminator [Paludibacter sp.]MDD4199172.1 UpxY family transcription antiterminator [Paludibacter sp.]MDD4428560.1 UpxY family transcription antiterminator [Paludibacter sp.]